jgi:heptosyltransferase-2
MKVLLLELWGLGDAVLMTAVLRPLVAGGAAVTVVGKSGTVALLRPSYPEVNYVIFDAPWTVFRNKYRLWRWPWRGLFRLIRSLRPEKFDAAASVRNDPRDHLLMFLSGAKERIGFPRHASEKLLTVALPVKSAELHRVDYWRQIGETIAALSPGKPAVSVPAEPWLHPAAYPPNAQSRAAMGAPAGRGGSLPVIGLHCGARIPVRRWPEEFFATTLRSLREEAPFHLALFPDVDGYGRALAPLADSCHEAISIPQLAAELAGCDAVICNDSGPAHIAAALDVPVLAIFGPGNPHWFRPYGSKHHMVIRDICPFRPCFDYCRFSQPVCLTELTPEEVWPEIRLWFRHQLESFSLSRP